MKGVLPMSVGWRYSNREEGDGHHQVTDGQVDDKVLCWLQGGLFSIRHEQQDPVSQYGEHTCQAELYNIWSSFSCGSTVFSGKWLEPQWKKYIVYEFVEKTVILKA